MACYRTRSAATIMPSLKIEFPGSTGYNLVARLDIPDGPPQAFAVFAHCFTCSKDTKAPTYISRALLVFHSPIDDVVNIDNARRINEAAKHPKSFITLDDADHMLSRAEDGLYVGHVLAAWARRYLPAPVRIDRVPAGKVHVAERRTGKFANIVRPSNRVLYADEPVSVGGTDTGLSPYELLSAALGACTSMTLRMYADLKKLPVEAIAVEVTHAKIHAQDCAECETKEGKIDRFEREIRITGDLDAMQRAKLLEIADKCPVHRTLHAEVEVLTKLG